jgi:hypothetical protein
LGFAIVLDFEEVEYVTDHAVESVENSAILEQLIDGTRVAPGPDCGYSGRIARLNMKDDDTSGQPTPKTQCNGTTVHEPL